MFNSAAPIGKIELLKAKILMPVMIGNNYVVWKNLTYHIIKLNSVALEFSIAFSVATIGTLNSFSGLFFVSEPAQPKARIPQDSGRILFRFRR